MCILYINNMFTLYNLCFIYFRLQKEKLLLVLSLVGVCLSHGFSPVNRYKRFPTKYGRGPSYLRTKLVRKLFDFSNIY